MRILAAPKKYFLENSKKVLTNNEKRGIILLVVITKGYALLAQLVEHLTLNQGVRGSSPRWRTTKNA